MDDNGDFVAVWSGNGKDYSTPTADNQGVFLQRFDLPTDTTGPRPIQTYVYQNFPTAAPRRSTITITSR